MEMLLLAISWTFSLYFDHLVRLGTELAFFAIFSAFFIHLLVIIVNGAKCRFRRKDYKAVWLPPDWLIAYHAFIYYYIILFTSGVKDNFNETLDGWVECGKKRLLNEHPLDISLSAMIFITFVLGVLLPAMVAAGTWLLLFSFGTLLLMIVSIIGLLLKYTWWLWLIGGVAYIIWRAIKSYQLRQKVIDEEIIELKSALFAIATSIATTNASPNPKKPTRAGRPRAKTKKKKETPPPTGKDEQ
ncbi:MAG: hypothetical protein WC473_03530 [Patescibacteria group bacterium]